METFLLVLTNAIGGSTYPATSVMLRGFDDRDAAVLRMGITALLFAPFLWRARRRLRGLSARDWASLAGVGILGYSLPLALGNYAQTLSTSSSAALFIGMEPVSIVVLSSLFLGERMNGLKAVSLVLGLAGATLIAFQGPPRFDGALDGRARGDLLLAVSGFCWGLYTVLGKPVLKRVDSLDFTAVTTLFAFLGLAVWGGPGLRPAAWGRASAGSWLAMSYLAVAGSFFGAWIWNAALSRVEASRQANFIFLQPLVGVAIGAGLLGDPLTRWTAAGGALVLGGMFVATRIGAAEPG